VRYLQGIKALFEDIDLKTEVFEGLDEPSPKEGILPTAASAGMTYR
jgi:3-hydroxyacyl-CoA dehydrogenase